MIPDGVENASLRTDGPFAYRDLDACLDLLSGYVETVERFCRDRLHGSSLRCWSLTGTRNGEWSGMVPRLLS